MRRPADGGTAPMSTPLEPTTILLIGSGIRWNLIGVSG